MVLSTATKNLGKLAALLGIIEGIAWTCMSIISIILHFWAPDLEIGTTYREYLNDILYHKFILDDIEMSGATFIVTGTAFNIFMWIYFVLSVLWCSLSIDQITAIMARKNRQVVVMRLWGGLTLFMSLVDLLFTMLLALDYTSCGGTSSTTIDDQYFCYLAVGIVMAIGSRGFTLWLINIILAIILITVLRREPNFESLEDSNSSLYSTIPRAKLARPLSSPDSRNR